MLTDSEIIELRTDINYQNIIRNKIEHAAKDLLKSATGDLNPEISTIIRIVKNFFKESIIRKEFSLTTKNFLENFLNRELKWPREPQSVKEICESRNDFLWMRYDEERVKALLNKAIDLLKDAEYRSLIKVKSSISEDPNTRLNAIIIEMKILLKKTLSSIRFKGIYDGWFDYSKDEYFELNGENMQAEFTRRIQSGNIGLPIKNEGENE